MIVYSGGLPVHPHLNEWRLVFELGPGGVTTGHDGLANVNEPVKHTFH